MNQELKKIGEKLNISETDINRIIKENKKKNGKFINFSVLLAIGFLFFILGLLGGVFTGYQIKSYPSCMNPVFFGFLSKKNRKNKLALPIITAIVFLSAYISKPVLGLELGNENYYAKDIALYNVFSKNKILFF